MTSSLNYDLVIFDWDGVLVDSQGIYRLLDQQFVKDFYGADVPVEEFYRLSDKIKTGAVNGSENDYYRHLDALFGDGRTPLAVIWENIYKAAPTIQAQIDYTSDAVEVLRRIRSETDLPIALATSSGRKDLEFFSSNKSLTAKTMRPLEFFDFIVTFDDVRKAKPDPESYLKMIKHFGVRPDKVLVFEDSLSGVKSAKSAGAQVAVLRDRHSDKDRTEIERLQDYHFGSWSEFSEKAFQ